jgi:pimeloyl-ACP methyl ester carboxylesterase
MVRHPDLDRFDPIDVRANGIRFHVRTAGSARSERLALCLHGFPECWFSWRELMPRLAKMGYRVWAPDLRGYGMTDKPRGVGAYRMDELVADVAGLVDASGAKEVALIAHDWGGAIAWDFARRAARPLERLVIMNAPHPAVFAKHVLRPAQMRRSWYMFLFQLPRLPEWYLSKDDYRAVKAAFLAMTTDRRRYPREVLEVYRDSASQPGAIEGMLAYYRAAFRYRGRQRGGKIATPTLLVWGEEDTALGRELTYGLERYVEDIEVRYVPDASHWVQQDAPERVGAMVEAFLARKDVPLAVEIAEPAPPR